MLSIPAEILLEIGRTDLKTYRGMLAVPKFARAVTIGYRLDIMEANGYNYSIMMHNNLPKDRIIGFQRSARTQFLTFVGDKNADNIRAYIVICDVSVYAGFETIQGYCWCIKHTSYNSGFRTRSSNMKTIDKYGIVR